MFEHEKEMFIPDITKDKITYLYKHSPRRTNNSRNENEPTVHGINGNYSFSTKVKSHKIIIEAETSIKLTKTNDVTLEEFPIYEVKDLSLDDKEKLDKCLKKQGTRIYINDFLSLSIAFDYNLIIENGNSKGHTVLGDIENEAKNKECQDSIDEMIKIFLANIKELPYYKDADLICAVPPAKDKDFDLPSKIVEGLSKKLNKKDITKGFILNGKKKPIKDADVKDKWEIWENAKVTFDKEKYTVHNKSIILVDDKYQSGITMQYIAMILKKAGAKYIYGMSFVKTLSNTD